MKMKYITLKKRKKTINATELTRREETQMGTRLTSQYRFNLAPTANGHYTLYILHLTFTQAAERIFFLLTIYKTLFFFLFL